MRWRFMVSDTLCHPAAKGRWFRIGVRNLVRLRHQGRALWAFRSQAPMASRIWSACGADVGHLAPSGSKGPA